MVERVLGALVANPWMNARHIAVHAKLPEAEVEVALTDALNRGLAQMQGPARSARYMATEAGVMLLASGRSELVRSIRSHAQLSARRTRWIRVADEISRWVNDTCAASAHYARFRGGDAQWQALVPRRRKGSHVMVHGRLAIMLAGQVQAWHLLFEPGWGDVARHRTLLQYLAAWQTRHERAHPDQPFPGLLVIARDAYRAGIVLGLAGRIAPRLPCAVTPQWQVATLFGVQEARWWSSLINGATGEVNPFTRSGLPEDAFAKGAFRIARLPESLKAYRKPYSLTWLGHPAPDVEVRVGNLSTHTRQLANLIVRHPNIPAQLATTLAMIKPELAQAALTEAHQAGLIEPADMSQVPVGWIVVNTTAARNAATELKKFDQALLARIRRTCVQTAHAQSAHGLSPLAFTAHALSAHGLSPHDLALAFAGNKTVEVRRVQGALQRLERAGCVARTPAAGYDNRWVATEAMVRLRAVEQGVDEEAAARRHGYFTRVMARHAQHTQATYMLISGICEYVRRRAAAESKVQVAGKMMPAPAYQVVAVGSEHSHTRAFTQAGARRVWRPDGFVAIRFGNVVREYWIEMASFNPSRETRSRDEWLNKADVWCAYAASGAWRLTYAQLPVLLIVAHDMREGAVAADALATATKRHGLAIAPTAWVSTRRALAKSTARSSVPAPQLRVPASAVPTPAEPLILTAAIWTELATGRTGTPFDGFKQTSTVVQGKPDLIGDIERAERAGVISAALRGAGLLRQSERELADRE